MVALNDKFYHNDTTATKMGRRQCDCASKSVQSSKSVDSFVSLCRRGEQRFLVDRSPLHIGQTTDVGGVSIGRWLQRDPIGVAGGINLYEYVVCDQLDAPPFLSRAVVVRFLTTHGLKSISLEPGLNASEWQVRE